MRASQGPRSPGSAPEPLPAAAARLVSWLVGEGAEVFEVRPARRTLEELFLELVAGEPPGPGPGGQTAPCWPPLESAEEERRR